ncbi:hypothetical protein [Paraburkholderia megapolitana]|uniref:hypothetical protein n=1 Tax=Paraburkholderia megapolitana TaxID=420953 RepID=UPI0038BE0484
MNPPEALPVSRLPKQTLHHVWSPKLKRALVFTSLDQVRLWVMLEANPAVTTYCERPALVSAQHDCRVDFWLLRDGRPQYLALGRTDEPVPSGDGPPAALSSLSIEIIRPTELDRHRIWIQNWMALLPYLNTGMRLIDVPLSRDVVNFFDPEASFLELEQHFVRHDPVLIRTAAIAGLHAGHLVSADLVTQSWTLNSRIQQYSKAAHHAS